MSSKTESGNIVVELIKDKGPLIEKSEDSSIVLTKKKEKSKRQKKREYNNENISVKSSFNKFDALQKRNLIHNPNVQQKSACRLCDKPVYKMEEVIVKFKTDTEIYHKSCIRCKDCAKQLKFDNYQTHEGNLYCIVHFKLLFAPKVVQESTEPKSRKSELIIRESQPIELPPDVARASDKPDLGLNELYQLNVRSRFQVFENGDSQIKEEQQKQSPRIGCVNSILTKYRINKIDNEHNEFGLLEDKKDKYDVEEEENDRDPHFLRSSNIQKERPVGIGDALNDIKTKFEKGHLHAKEERREERKQEIQNIRSRLFMGKQAKIKEMYQQAVAESEQVVTSVGKKPDIEIGAAAQVIKERFEKGEMFADKANIDLNSQNGSTLSEDADVFESAISKESRNIFMELDANNASISNANNNGKRNQTVDLSKNQNQYGQENVGSDVVKCDSKPEHIQIATAEISQKFKFFETYRPNHREKRPFRITPPREGVVKMPTPESDAEQSTEEKQKRSFQDNVLQKTQTTSAMLNKFREMEQNKSKESQFNGLRPLKCFTPPPEDRPRYFDRSNSDDDEDEDEDDDDDDDDDGDESDVNNGNLTLVAADDALKEVHNAARAKQLRAKFEKWQAKEMKRELNEGYVDIYSQDVSDDSTIESAKTIRERFENMKNIENKKLSGSHCYQVNRFV